MYDGAASGRDCLIYCDRRANLSYIRCPIVLRVKVTLESFRARRARVSARQTLVRNLLTFSNRSELGTLIIIPTIVEMHLKYFSVCFL